MIQIDKPRHCDKCQQTAHVTYSIDDHKTIIASCDECGCRICGLTLEDYKLWVQTELIDEIKASFEIDIDSRLNELWREHTEGTEVSLTHSKAITIYDHSPTRLYRFQSVSRMLNPFRAINA